MADSPEKKSRFWSWPKKKWLLGIPIGGFVMLLVGAAGLQIMNTVLHATSTTEFCLACHSHDINIRPEWEAASHTNNRTGVRAECADCHLPSMEEHWAEYVITKIIVSFDIIPELQGKITAPEDYERHRPEMFEHVVRQMKADDSRFCRNCHLPEAMLTENQSPMARRRHERMVERGQTCIDCHYGMVHKLPENFEEILDRINEDFASARLDRDDGTRVASSD